MKNDGSEMKGKVLYFLRETIIVVIGVLIAVTLNNYKESLDNQDYLDRTLEAIQKEIDYNRKDLDTVLTTHNALLEHFIENIENDEKAIVDLIVEKGGLQVATLKNISLRFFVANKAEIVDFEVISQLSEIEENVNMLSLKMEKLLDFSYANLQAADSDTKTRFYFYLQNVINSEEGLLEKYEEFVQQQNFEAESNDSVSDTIR